MKIHFGPLLAAGKSLVRGEVSGRYRMREGIRLPQFISPKNPFATETGATEAAAPAVALNCSAVVSAAAPVMAPVSFRVRLGEGLKRAALWCLDRNPLSGIGRPRLPAMPHFGKRAVQPELSLDKVEVVRGDLAHADLEVVNAGGASNVASNAAWRNLTTRVFGGGAR